MRRTPAAFIALTLTATLIALCGYFAWQHFHGASGRTSVLERYADQAIATCKGSAYPPGCYDKEIPKFLDSGVSMQEAFEITRIVQSRTKGYFFCHNLGHEIAAKEVAKDPANWVQVLARCPMDMCANGCLHGAIQSRFNADSLTDAERKDLIPTLGKLCEPGGAFTFTALTQRQCYHALGHVTVYATSGKATDAIAMCDAIAASAKAQGAVDVPGARPFDRASICYTGVFMLFFQQLEPEDFAAVAGTAPTTTEAAVSFCSALPERVRATCHRESWTLYGSQLTTADGIERFCSAATNPTDLWYCYQNTLFGLAAKLQLDESAIAPLCESFPKGVMGQCFGASASRLLETDVTLAPRAAALCKTADEHGVGEYCYGEYLFDSTSYFGTSSPSFPAVCGALPAPWNAKCLAGDGLTVPVAVP